MYECLAIDTDIKSGACCIWRMVTYMVTLLLEMAMAMSIVLPTFNESIGDKNRGQSIWRGDAVNFMNHMPSTGMSHVPERGIKFVFYVFIF